MGAPIFFVLVGAASVHRACHAQREGQRAPLLEREIGKDIA
jgi:hypothetical protein